MSEKRSIAVIGAGTMGAGIAQVAAMHGCRVHLIDVKAEFVQRGIDAIRKNLDRLVEKGKLAAGYRDAAMAKIHGDLTIEDLEVTAGTYPPLSPLIKGGGEQQNAACDRDLPPSLPRRGQGEVNNPPLFPLSKGGGANATGDGEREALADDPRGLKSAARAHPPLSPLMEGGGKSATADPRELKLAARLSDVDLAIEAVVEDIGVKQDVFRKLEAVLSPTAILATNTSSLSVSRIAEAVKNPGRVVGMHFFNPAPLMPLVEIIAGEKSDSAAVDFAFVTAVEWGKTAVRAKDTPGFIVNRVARGYYLEALRLLGEGVAGVDEIDGIMRRCGNFKMGPFELMDLVGLDVNLAVSTSVWEQMNKHPRFEPHEIQKQLVAKGHLGRKSGRGFYSYDREPPLPAIIVDRRSFTMSPLLADAIRAFAMRGMLAVGPTFQSISATSSTKETDRNVGPTRDGQENLRGTAKPPVVPLGKGDGASSLSSPLVKGGGESREEDLRGTGSRKENLRGPQMGSTEQYVFTRILAAVINEAGLAFDEGVATREDIDLAMMKGTNYPHGPLAWANQIGVRTVRGVLAMLNDSVGRGRYSPAGAFSVSE